ncbi:hypothetical protein K6W78_31305 [Burkholderia cepacia]|uniref:hypothetical protein n=1 Tax=Burkholderia cepacia TaxID=292 RepID=UPI001C97976E|nr:hypothetical protein [Burkholderia cepacia]MBY4804465.1 hypothetical protein [Burkholderia cepacia]
MPIKLAFKDEKLRKVCESPRSAKLNYGEAVGRAIHGRLADLRAAESPLKYVEWGFGKFDETADNRIVIPIDGGYRMVAEAYCPNPDEQGAPDWGQVTRVKILFIERTNES